MDVPMKAIKTMESKVAKLRGKATIKVIAPVRWQTHISRCFSSETMGDMVDFSIGNVPSFNN
tara:strand:- start:218 stop:403 length:186 start_codon:yes stop_codon:yes gene_type:complete